MLDWIDSPELRMEFQAGLSKGEARHTLARAVFAHYQGRIRDRTHDAQQERVMALNLVITAIVYWNTLYIWTRPPTTCDDTVGYPTPACSGTSRRWARTTSS